MVVQHNLTAINANRYFGMNNTKLSKSLEKLSSGYAINRAGDNAAGLAVSEKMRAQISGINQGVKNAQDGISMVQTFEGALTETDSILQRMRTLATQSANGTYQNDVDREAIQLEYNQLNDELNQIADTDFNGVVVLNGGTMADGLEQVNGEFNYGNRTDAEAEALKKNQEAFKAAGDFCGDPDGVGKVVDNANYSKTDADEIWKKLGIEVKSTDIAKPDELQLTFSYDGNKWKANGVTDADGKKINVDSSKLDSLTVTPTANGGFKVDGTSLNLVFDTKNVGKYDQATVKLQNVKAENYAPTNAGLTESSYDSKGLTKGTVAAPTKVQLDSTTVNDTEMAKNDNLKSILDTIKGKDIELTYTAGAVTGAKIGGGATLDVNDSTGTKIGTVSVTNDGKIQYTSAAAGATATTIATVTLGTASADAAGTVKFSVNFDAYNYLDSSKLKAETVATPDASKKTLDMFDAKASGGVSKSDSNEASTATLTYKDNITLQVGARTKDSVNFTFKYASNGLGDLKADMDCSARGLGTDQLSLATQESANVAIDKIDNALNKVSMVRGTFGAVQNRLEHKIDNLNTTSENLTSAESRIRDTNMAEEMMNFTKNQILSQASQSMLAQANQLPQGVLSLLQ